MDLNTPMVFEQLRDSIEALLIANQAGLFRTVGGQNQSTASAEIKGTLRSINIFYQSGNYNNKSSKTEKEHDVEFTIEYHLSMGATANRTVLDDPDSTTSQLQIALAEATNGFKLADVSMDAFRRIITQVLLDPVNEDLGLPAYTVGAVKLNNFRKNPPLDDGRLITLTATETLTTNVTEKTIGATPTPAEQPFLEAQTRFTPPNGDPNSQTGDYSQTGTDIKNT